MTETLAQRLTKKVKLASEAQENDQTGSAIKLYEEVIKEPIKNKEDDLKEETIRAKETAIYNLGAIYKEKGLVDELITLQKTVLPLLTDFPKAKTAKIMRTLFDLTLKGQEGRYPDMIDLAKYIIEWCEKEERSFLRMKIETCLADLYFKKQDYQLAIGVLKELTY